MSSCLMFGKCNRGWSDAYEVPTLQSFGVDRQYFDGVLDTMCEQAFGSGSPNNNPRVPDATQMLSLYRKLWD